MHDVAMPEFEKLVEDALDSLPQGILDLLDNVVFLVEEEGEHPDIMGLYDGIPLTERYDYGAVMPDRVFIYRKGVCAVCENDADVIEEVYVTVVHEIAHFFGIDDDRLHELGWD